jgi:uncharacterized membrane protein YsdA (DUF1294 family)
MYRRHRYQINAIVLTSLGAILLFGALYAVTSWSLYLLWIISLSAATFALFGIDKALSKSQAARIPESVLHLFTLLGGFLGQILGRYTFHHKTNFKRHPSFTYVFIISVVLQLGLYYFVIR